MKILKRINSNFNKKILERKQKYNFQSKVKYQLLRKGKMKKDYIKINANELEDS